MKTSRQKSWLVVDGYISRSAPLQVPVPLDKLLKVLGIISIINSSYNNPRATTGRIVRVKVYQQLINTDLFCSAFVLQLRSHRYSTHYAQTDVFTGTISTKTFKMDLP